MLGNGTGSRGSLLQAARQTIRGVPQMLVTGVQLLRGYRGATLMCYLHMLALCFLHCAVTTAAQDVQRHAMREARAKQAIAPQRGCRLVLRCNCTCCVNVILC
jgi:hypothetical protein